jgi:murein DD-endopeptidase MepM/ murein hydrolase activator NlpD
MKGRCKNYYMDYAAKRDDGKGPYYHKGFDIGRGDDQAHPIYSPVAGTLIEVYESPSYYPWVVIVRDGNGFYHRFAHLQKQGIIQWWKGRTVIAGQLLGYWSSTANNRRVEDRMGKTTRMGAHVHYEITTTPRGPTAAGWPEKFRDPYTFLLTGLYATKRPRFIKTVYPLWVG